MHEWHWHEWQGLPYLNCSLLEPWVHGFFTQQWWPRNPQDIAQILAPGTTAHRLKQVHGNQVIPAQTATTAAQFDPDQGTFMTGDGLTSDGSDQFLWVATADCTPVLIGDVTTGQVAAIHAGWRGTAAQIVPVAIQKFQAQGSHLRDLRVALGPAIAGSIYQVASAVAAEVGQTIVSSPTSPSDLGSETTEAILAALWDLPNCPLSPDPEVDRVRLDVRRVNVLQLTHMGLSLEQIAVSSHCTYQQPDHFFSYRRTNHKKVQWSGIVSRYNR
jgi:YfiH family protein